MSHKSPAWGTNMCNGSPTADTSATSPDGADWWVVTSWSPMDIYRITKRLIPWSIQQRSMTCPDHRGTYDMFLLPVGTRSTNQFVTPLRVTINICRDDRNCVRRHHSFAGCSRVDGQYGRTTYVADQRLAGCGIVSVKIIASSHTNETARFFRRESDADYQMSPKLFSRCRQSLFGCLTSWMGDHRSENIIVLNGPNEFVRFRVD